MMGARKLFSQLNTSHLSPDKKDVYGNTPISLIVLQFLCAI